MGESVLFDEKVMWYKKKLQAFPGRLVITDTSISFNQDRISVPGTGLLGSLITRTNKRTKGGELLNAPLNTVNFAKGKPMGKKSFMLEVTTNTHDVFRFLFDEKWLSKIEHVVQL